MQDVLRMQLALRRVSGWAFDRGMGVNPRKYKPPLLPLRLHGEELKLLEKAWFLGLVFNKKKKTNLEA